ncbi:hypothetical protein COO60DRAFT_1458394 [Scenedesmus sp. NREL 46B-D3]|nr:hypothetical protein COO60DRAFT_1458394 [Scenedesmus sp. NREL 46B-D3]
MLSSGPGMRFRLVSSNSREGSVPVRTGTEPSRLFEDTSLKRMPGPDESIKVEQQMDAYTLHCFTLPELVRMAAAGVAAQDATAAAAVGGFMDQLKQQHLVVQQRTSGQTAGG